MTSVGFASHLVNGILAIKPLADFAKHQAREMMINRAEDMGVPWRASIAKLRDRFSAAEGDRTIIAQAI